MEFTVGILIGLVLGVAIAFVVAKSRLRKTSVGDLRVDMSDPSDGPYLFLELKGHSALQRILDSKTVIFAVKKENYVTQK